MESKLTITERGSKIWKNDAGKTYRNDGPAVEYYNGDKIWAINGEVHREDGPAAEFADGTKYWYYHGRYITNESQKEFKRIIQLLIFT